MQRPDERTDSDRETFEGALGQAAGAVGIALDASQHARMWVHFRLVTETNRRFNLTRITSPADAAVKHYADSLALLACPGIDRVQSLRVLDVGTGAGFPAVPLAIVCDAWHVTAIDGTMKKARFVADSAKKLGLANVVARHARAADLARQPNSRFDLVLLRAVAKLGAGLREVHPLVRSGGSVVFYKTTPGSHDEHTEGLRAAEKLRLTPLLPFEVTLPAGDGPIHRRIIRYASDP